MPVSPILPTAKTNVAGESATNGKSDEQELVEEGEKALRSRVALIVQMISDAEIRRFNATVGE